MNKKILLSLLVIAACLGNSLVLQGSQNFEGLIDGEKTYMSADQVIVSDHGIFFLLQEENGLLAKVLVSQINYDQNGLYILAESIPSPQSAWCRLGHKACNKCGRCNHPGCPTPPCKCR